MGFRPGSRIGPYEIVAAVGAGGMGEVYRAHDARLQRDVAIKVLPESVANDPNRLARFEREARLLAALDHPSIARVHGLEESPASAGSGPAVRALVMEFVEGETLDEKLRHGGLAIDEALEIARQIAEALASAHERGIVHRDLKPANIKIRRDGSVKVLDFGLAKAIDPVDEPRSSRSASPTMTSPVAMTGHGTILGTAAYMAPEQARGAPVDKRADIWAFGCVLFEILTGGSAFGRESVADTVAHILKSDPEWSRLPADTPPAVKRLLRRCLAKDPKERLHDIADARLEIVEAQALARDDESADRAAASRRRAPVWAMLAVISVIGGVAVATLVWGVRRDPPTAQEMRVDIATPPTIDVESIAMSPDGQSIAFNAAEGSRRRLWLRSLTSGITRSLNGTDGALLPFWAPNGKSIGFFADDGRLKRIDIDGGIVRTIANAPLPWGGSWSTDDTILFAPATGSIFRVSSSGGQATPVTKLVPGQSNHMYPWFLPDGRHFLYYTTGSPEVRGVYVASVEDPQGRRLVDTDSIAACATSGHLLFVRGSTLFAQPLDPARRELTGTAFPVGESIAMQASVASLAALSASQNGRIAYRTATGVPRRQFIWVDRTGQELQTIGEPDDGNPLSPSLSPDGRRIAMHRNVGGNVDIWLLDIDRGVLSRFTSNPANEINPLWSPDGGRILFASNRNGAYQLYEKPITGESDEKPAPLQSPAAQATDWSPDGRTVLFQRRDPKASADIWAFQIGGSQQPFPIVESADFDEREGQFSPDGKWIAYASTESGRWEVYVQPFPGPGGRVRVSINGGLQVRWRPDGKELFFIALDDRMMAAPITLSSGGPPLVGVPAALFQTRIGGAVQTGSRQQYFVARDGQRFLMNTVLSTGPASPITLILNWNPGRSH